MQYIRSSLPLVVAAVFALLTIAPVEARKPTPFFNILIKGGTLILDGDSGPQELGEIGIVGDKIAYIGARQPQADADVVIDATGLLIVPGFIDTHSHADRGGKGGHLWQGVTTIIAGNCGRSRGNGDMAAHLEALAGEIGPNHATLVGHNSLRAMAGVTDQPPTEEQMTLMKEILRDGMTAGALGLSTGLIYSTGYNSTTDEIVELAKVAKEMDGIYASHIRNEGPTVLEAVREAIEIGRRAEIPVQISHIKCAGPKAWNKSDEYLALIHESIKEGIDIKMDQYPYTASQTGIDALFPPWAKNDWRNAIENERERLAADTAALLASRGGAERVYFNSGPFKNKWLSNAATEAAKDPVDLLIDDVGKGGASAVYHQMLDEDVQNLMSDPLTMIGSDGPTATHPRGQGAFPRVWAYYGRELGIFSHQELVNKTSTLASQQFKLDKQKRGAIKTGWFADLVIFDPEKIKDNATFEEPTREAEGIDWVIVNGTIAVQDGELMKTNPGAVLRLQDSQVPGESE